MDGMWSEMIKCVLQHDCKLCRSHVPIHTFGHKKAKTINKSILSMLKYHVSQEKEKHGVIYSMYTITN